MKSTGEPQYGDLCTCGASKSSEQRVPGGPRVPTCNLTDCQLPWAVKYRASVQPKWYERIIGTIVAFIIGRRP